MENFWLGWMARGYYGDSEGERGSLVLFLILAGIVGYIIHMINKYLRMLEFELIQFLPLFAIGYTIFTVIYPAIMEKIKSKKIRFVFRTINLFFGYSIFYMLTVRFEAIQVITYYTKLVAYLSDIPMDFWTNMIMVIGQFVVGLFMLFLQFIYIPIMVIGLFQNFIWRRRYDQRIFNYLRKAIPKED